jgi:hypothetical protein
VGRLIIESGDIISYGGRGAGIGSSSGTTGESSVASIQIYGGNIVAFSADSSAGIGSGLNHSTVDELLIDGGWIQVFGGVGIGFVDGDSRESAAFIEFAHGVIHIDCEPESQFCVVADSIFARDVIIRGITSSERFFSHDFMDAYQGGVFDVVLEYRVPSRPESFAKLPSLHFGYVNLSKSELYVLSYIPKSGGSVADVVFNPSQVASLLVSLPREQTFEVHYRGAESGISGTLCPGPGSNPTFRVAMGEWFYEMVSDCEAAPVTWFSTVNTLSSDAYPTRRPSASSPEQGNLDNDTAFTTGTIIGITGLVFAVIVLSITVAVVCYKRQPDKVLNEDALYRPYADQG